AEDGIRDFHVTGVQTCALPISGTVSVLFPLSLISTLFSLTLFSNELLILIVILICISFKRFFTPSDCSFNQSSIGCLSLSPWTRSEERRVGKECSSWCAP